MLTSGVFGGAPKVGSITGRFAVSLLLRYITESISTSNVNEQSNGELVKEEEMNIRGESTTGIIKHKGSVEFLQVINDLMIA
jgi:hypothetical protein